VVLCSPAAGVGRYSSIVECNVSLQLFEVRLKQLDGPTGKYNVFNVALFRVRPPLWSSGQSSWLQTQRSWIRFQVLPDFLSSFGSRTGSNQPREDK
jgi:hypothetical protein